MKRKTSPRHIHEYKGFTITRGYRSALNPHPLYYITYYDGNEILYFGGFYSIDAAKDYIDTLI